MESQRSQIIDWIYSLQIVHNDPAAPSVSLIHNTSMTAADTCLASAVAPFSASSHAATTRRVIAQSVCGPNCGRDIPVHAYDTGNLAATYTALALLAILGDDFTRLRRDAIIQVGSNLTFMLVLM